MTGCSRHATFIDLQKEKYPHKRPLELERGCDTRWSSRANAVTKVHELYDVILDLLSNYVTNLGPSCEEANALLTRIQTRKFVFLLVLFKNLFSISDAATNGLQSKKTRLLYQTL